MARGRELALALRKYLGIRGRATEDDLDGVIADFGVQVQASELPPELPFEVVAGDTVIIRRGLTTRDRCWGKGHALAHLVCHCGDQRQLDGVLVDKQELSADEFAVWFLLGGELPEWRPQTHAELLEWAELPPEALPALLGYLRG